MHREMQCIHWIGKLSGMSIGPPNTFSSLVVKIEVPVVVAILPNILQLCALRGTSVGNVVYSYNLI